MDLNLNSLKNLSPTPESADEKPNVPVAEPSEHWPASLGASEVMDISTEPKAPVAGPKISLMKMKKASSMVAQDTKTAMSETEAASVQDNAQKVPQPTDTVHAPSIALPTEKAGHAPRIVSPRETVTIFSSSEKEPTDTAQASWEARSILKDEAPQSTGIVETKEFFPKFRISEKAALDGDMLDIDDMVTIQENTPSEPLHDIPETIPTEEEAAVPEEPVAEVMPTESSPEAPSRTPEYVAEVKTELSGARRAGFRFFAQRKKKVLAGLGLIVLSLSAFTLFSGFPPSADMQKLWKSNIQESGIDIAPNDSWNEGKSPAAVTESATPSGTDEQTMLPPASESQATTDYRIGRDYSVTKNTKKNTRSKTSSGTSPATETPTPQKDLIK